LPSPPARHQEKAQLELASLATQGSASGAAPATQSPSIPASRHPRGRFGRMSISSI
jgi:hypothetical protein